MNTTVETPTSIRELTRHVEREHPRLSTSYNDRHEQVIVVGQPGSPEPPAALREIITSNGYGLTAQTATSRGRWLGVITPTDGGER